MACLEDFNFTDPHLRGLLDRFDELGPRARLMLGCYLASGVGDEDISREEFAMKLALVLSAPSTAEMVLRDAFPIRERLTISPEERMSFLRLMLTELYARPQGSLRAA